MAINITNKEIKKEEKSKRIFTNKEKNAINNKNNLIELQQYLADYYGDLYIYVLIWIIIII